METSSEMRAVAVLLQRLICTLDQFKCNLQIARAFRNCCLQCVLMLSGLLIENNNSDNILSNSPINRPFSAHQIHQISHNNINNSNNSNNSNINNNNNNLAWSQQLALSLGALEEFLSLFERYFCRCINYDRLFPSWNFTLLT
jgi:hypothetical protein